MLVQTYIAPSCYGFSTTEHEQGTWFTHSPVALHITQDPAGHFNQMGFRRETQAPILGSLGNMEMIAVVENAKDPDVED